MTTMLYSRPVYESLAVGLVSCKHLTCSKLATLLFCRLMHKDVLVRLLLSVC
jgi:hypothetical protein